MSDDIIVGSVAVDVVPSTKSFRRKLDADLQGLRADVALNLDDADLRAQLADITRERTATINVNADTAKAEAQIDAAARDRSVNIDTREASQGLGALATAAIALGPALVPITAAVAGLGAALGAPIAAAGGGLTVFGVIAGVAVKQTKEQLKQLDALDKKVAAARTSLQAATTPAGKKSAQVELAAATDAYATALKALTPEQKKFADSEDRLKRSFAGLVASSGGAIFGPLNKGMDTLAGILPKLSPLLDGVARGIGVLLGDINKATRGAGFKAFMASFGQSSLEAIVQFGRIFENFGRGIVGVFRAFGPLATGFMRSLSDMAQDFADFGKTAGQNEGLKRFVDYVQQVGPKVAATFGSLFRAIGKIGEALAPIGGVALDAIKAFADTIRAIPTPILSTIAAGAVSLAVGLKAIALAKAGITALQTLGTTLGGLGRSGSGLTAAQSAVRGLAGAGGLGLLAASASTANGGLKLLGNVGGGAMLGFSLGGPIGGAIGAGAGALLGLWENTKKSTDGFKKSIPTLDDYAASLNGITGAATKQTKADALAALQKSGALKIGQRLGLSARTQVNAALGNQKAQQRVNAALQDQAKLIDNLYKKFQHGAPGDNAFNISKVKQAQQDYKTLAGTIGASAKQFRNAQNAQRDLRQATFDYSKLVKNGMPKRVVTDLKLNGFPETTKQVAELAAKYKGLSEHDIKTLVRLGNVQTTLGDVARLTSVYRSVPKEIKTTFTLALSDPSNVARFLKTGSAGVGKAELSLAARADGGPVASGQAYLVGERGPEIFTPSQNGQIIPNGGRQGPQFVVEKVVAQDVNHLLHQMQDRSRTAALGGLR